MSRPNEKKEFESWYQALQARQLTPEQVTVLQAIVDEGQADTLARAAQLLDWQDSVIDPVEHLYGF
jgi:hypothetical protein